MTCPVPLYLVLWQRFTASYASAAAARAVASGCCCVGPRPQPLANAASTRAIVKGAKWNVQRDMTFSMSCSCHSYTGRRPRIAFADDNAPSMANERKDAMQLVQVADNSYLPATQMR